MLQYYGINHAAGTFSGGAGIIGFDNGIVLSTGKISDVVGPNKEDATTTANGQPGDPDLDSLIPGYTTFDRAALEFDFIPNTNVLTFDYVFGSEEYNEYVNSPYNNIFGFFLNGKNVAIIPGTTTPVSINNVNGGNPYGSSNAKNKEYFRNNDLNDGGGSINTELDGLTVVLKVTVNVNPGVTNHIKLAIADAGDSVLDSDVFIKGGSFSSPKVAELAKSVLGKNYKLEFYNAFTKGWKNGRFVDSGEIEYLDCSGLIFWSYNKAYGATKYQDRSNPVYYEGATNQFQPNADPQLNDFTVSVSESELLPGDALFFDWNKNGRMDHVAMYVGSYTYSGIINDIKYEGTYDVVNALNPSTGIKPDRVASLKEQDGFVGFRRLAKSKVGIVFNSHSPVDLIITDPDGNKISKDIWEIPGIFYYSEHDTNGDGNIDDMITAPVKKKGDYSITVVKEPNALPTDTYTLEVSTDDQTIVLADNVQISNIPAVPYVVKSTDTEIIPVIPTDTIPPTTTTSLSGTLGINGWYTSNVQVNLIATDNAGGSGVNKTEYSFDEATWTTFNAEFPITSEGTTTLYYRSIDNAGNVEPTKNQTIKIDKTSPLIESITLYPANATAGADINVTVQASDNVGVIEVKADGISLIYLNGEWNHGSIKAPSTIGSYTVTIRANDSAGNSAEKTASYSVVNPVGGIAITSIPKPLVINLSISSSGLLNVKLISTANIDDIVELTINTNGISSTSAINLAWFNRTFVLVKVPAGKTVYVPFMVSVPAGTPSGYKAFKNNAKAISLSATSVDTGAVNVKK